MKIQAILIEMIIFAAVFTAMIFMYYRGDRKYSPASIHNYPPDIQEEYFKTHEKVDVSYQSKNVLLTKGAGVLIFTGILLVCSVRQSADVPAGRDRAHGKGLSSEVVSRERDAVSRCYLRADPRGAGGVARYTGGIV